MNFTPNYVNEVFENNRKEKIGIVVDYPNWAFYNIAIQIKNDLSEKFDVTIYYLTDFENILSLFLVAEDCALLHFLWRTWLPTLGTDYTEAYARSLGLSYEEFKKRYIDNKVITTSVYDHLYLENDFKITKSLFSSNESVVRGYTVSSNKLYKIYQDDDRIVMKPSRVITDGVDLDLFKPAFLSRFVNRKPRQKLTIGWAGNSKWASEQEDYKGYHSIIKPVVDELCTEGYEIEVILADRSVKMIPHEDMPQFYAKIDLYVCASKIEGTPNPILECMACGVPFISTDVGVVPDVAGEKQSIYVLKERSRYSLKTKLKEILEHQDILKELSAENMESIKSWSWRYKTNEFEKFFRKFLGGENFD